jgi:uncharacterized protein with PIN domain
MKFEKPDDQLKFLCQMFGLSCEKKKLMSRCVKCNNDKIAVMDPEEAKKTLNWKDFSGARGFPEVTEFWVCENCKQIYWEGASFMKAKIRFEKFVDENMGGEGGVDGSDEWEDMLEDLPEEGSKKDSKLPNELPNQGKL